jgi:hypothetical protein
MLDTVRSRWDNDKVVKLDTVRIRWDNDKVVKLDTVRSRWDNDKVVKFISSVASISESIKTNIRIFVLKNHPRKSLLVCFNRFNGFSKEDREKDND